MAKKSKAKGKIAAFVALVVGVLIVVCLFLPFMSSKAESVLGDSESSHLTGADFLSGLFGEVENENVNFGVELLKLGEETKSMTNIVMICTLAAVLVGLAMIAFSIINLIKANGLSRLLIKILSLAALVLGVILIIGAAVIGSKLSVDVGGIAGISSTVAIGPILIAIGGLASVLCAYLFKK